jgi:hypothetical protein
MESRTWTGLKHLYWEKKHGRVGKQIANHDSKSAEGSDLILPNG